MSLDIYLHIAVDAGGATPYDLTLFTDNYTHNVTPMWCLAGVYEALYESHGKQAKDVIPVLEAGYAAMLAKPDDFRALNSPNKWGDYEGALSFLHGVLEACKQYPKAEIYVSR